MGIEPDRFRIVYFQADVVESEECMQIIGGFAGQMRNVTNGHHGVCQISQKMEIVVIVRVIHTV